ncbi:MAG: MATE family efflux transporter [Alphaproteobacteria bacterium]|nr:MATE family efflux transporter [Alphaproteobacteria bacterium]
MTSARSRLIDGPIGPTLVWLAAPNMLAAFVQSLISVVEGWLIGGLGIIALAGAALVFPLFMLTTMWSAGAIGGAVAGATARALGADDRAQGEAVLRAALVIALAGAAGMAVLIVGFGAVLFMALGGDGAVLQAALAYSRPLFVGIVAVWLFNIAASVLRGSGDTTRPAIALIVIATVHAPLAWVLIHTAGLGIAGAGFAMPIAYAVGAAMLFVRLRSGRAAVTLRRGGVPISATMPILRNGSLAAAQSAMTVGMSLVVTAIVGRLGIEWLAGYGIGARLEFLVIPIIFGIGGALIAMTGANVGAGRRQRAVRVAWTGGLTAAAIVGAIGILVALWPGLWVGLFSTDPATVAAAGLYFRLVGPFYGFFGLGLCLYFASQGLDSLVWPVIGTALRLVVVLVGGFGLLALDSATPTRVFMVVAAAMALYGLFVAAALRLGPWRPVTDRPVPSAGA